MVNSRHAWRWHRHLRRMVSNDSSGMVRDAAAPRSRRIICLILFRTPSQPPRRNRLQSRANGNPSPHPSGDRRFHPPVSWVGLCPHRLGLSIRSMANHDSGFAQSAYQSRVAKSANARAAKAAIIAIVQVIVAGPFLFNELNSTAWGRPSPPGSIKKLIRSRTSRWPRSAGTLKLVASPGTLRSGYLIMALRPTVAPFRDFILWLTQSVRGA